MKEREAIGGQGIRLEKKEEKKQKGGKEVKKIAEDEGEEED